MPDFSAIKKLPQLQQLEKSEAYRVVSETVKCVEYGIFLFLIYSFVTSYAFQYALDGEGYKPIIAASKLCVQQVFGNPYNVYPACDRRLGEFIIKDYQPAVLTSQLITLGNYTIKREMVNATKIIH